ncbi:MAG: hypothetical protein HDR06_07385, partial [Lachnospiraceae bacterium]|nr:hypothetical protein [Lachnospiraceae bacterium]
MKNKVKRNRNIAIAFSVLYVICAVCLFWFHPFVASAAETDTATKKVPGGKGNTVVFNSVVTMEKGYYKNTYSATLKADSEYEIVGAISEMGNIEDSGYYQVYFRVIGKDGKLASLSKNNLSDCVGVEMNYTKDVLQRSTAYSMDRIADAVMYKSLNDHQTITCFISGCKIFTDGDAMIAYAKTGSLEGMLRDIDDGEYDKEIGYLHDLKHHALMYGEELENGLYSSYDDRFTWSNYYPEYDDSYLVEVRASCEVEVKKWFGIGKSTVYNSNIRELARDVKYKDLEFIISLADERSTFSDFLNTYMPGNSSVSDVISAATYQFDAYYFRIYKWDEETETYKYGLWVRLTKNGSALTGSLDETIDAGDFDDDGNFKPDPGSDYGDGKPGITVPGVGDDRDGAKDDADKNQEDREDENKQIDLSNTNFKELWEWFTGLLLTFWNGLGVIPDFFGRIFSFLP